MKLPRLNRFRTGGSGNRLNLAVPVPTTPQGRVYRLSPNVNAHPRHFVLGNTTTRIELTEELRARMKLVPRSAQTVCPYSGFVAGDEHFLHPEDPKAVREIVAHAMRADLADEIARAFSGLSQFSSKHVSIKFTRGRTSAPPLPRFNRRDLLRVLVCDHCGRDYGVYAIGLFCPDCGAPNLRLHFAREVQLVHEQVSLADSGANVTDELAYRLLGNAHEDVLTAFEATLKTVYLHGMSLHGREVKEKKVRNDFQNIEKSVERFKELEIDPFEKLSEQDLANLRLNIQKRHVIGHNLGVADAKFVKLASGAKLGETVALVGRDIRRFGVICQSVVDELDAWLGGRPSPNIGKFVENTSKEKHDIAETQDVLALDLNLSTLARQIAVWTAKTCQRGLQEPVDLDAFREFFAGNGIDEIEEAVAELHAEGFIETYPAIGSRLPRFSPQLELYVTFDPFAVGSNPVGDAVALTEEILSGTNVISTPALFQKMGWGHRRFNPAVALVAAELDDRRVRCGVYPEFVVSSFSLIAEDKVALKRFMQRMKK